MTMNENTYTCIHCGKQFTLAEDEARQHMFDGCFVCDECVDEATTTCDYCGALHITSHMTELADGNFACEDCIEHYAPCADCGEWYPRDDLNEIANGSLVCETCLYDNYERCEDCGEWLPNDMIVTVNPRTGYEKYVCDECLDRGGYFQCDSCGGWYTNDFLGLSGDCGDPTYCDDCAENYRRCDECGNICHTNDMTWDDATDSYLCDRCFDAAQGGIHNYSYDPPFFLLGRTESDNMGEPYLGVELECDCGDLPGVAAWKVTDLTDYVYCKHDGSLANGYEIVTHPCTMSYHTERFPWADICSTSIKHGFRSHNTDTCGLHVHIGRKEIGGDETVAKLTVLVDHLWPEIDWFSRRNGNYSWSKKPTSLSCYYGTNTEDCILSAIKSDNDRHDRYMAVNTRNCDTVELRFCKGTLKVGTVLASIQLAHNLALFARDHSLQDCVTCAWDDVVHSYEYSELSDYVASRFAGFVATGREEPTWSIGEAPAEPENTHIAREDENLLGKVVTYVRNSNGYASYNHLLGATGVVVDLSYSGSIGVAWLGYTHGHGCASLQAGDHRGYWVEHRNLSVSDTDRYGREYDTESYRRAAIAGFLPGDKVRLRHGISEFCNTAVYGATGEIIGFFGDTAMVSWGGLSTGHSCDGRLGDTSGWNVPLAWLERV